MLITVGRFPASTTSKQRPSNVHNGQITLYEHWNNFVYQLGQNLAFLVENNKIQNPQDVKVKESCTTIGILSFHRVTR